MMGKIIPFYPRKEEEDKLDLDWVTGGEDYKDMMEECYYEYKNCVGTEEECDRELMSCL